VAIQGQVQVKNFTPTFYDLVVETREVAIAQPGIYKIVFSGDFTLKGPAGKALLSGTMDINDGIYTRDFSITQFFIRPQVSELPEAPSPWLKDIQLNLNIRSPGELAIKNNVANIYFNSDLRLTGPATDPKVGGALEVLDGNFHYFTINFTSAHGLIDFRNPKRGAYVNIDAEKNFEQAFSTASVVAHIEGFTDNLQLTFTSNPPMDRQNIMKLVFTGAIPGSTRAFNSGQLASSILASQLGQVIQRPLAQRAYLDIFRLEATDPERSTALSRLVVGKRLTERLSLQFKTDIGIDEPLQGVEMEYLLLDNVLLKGTQFSDGEFSFNLAWRFQLN
jgi:autotransporter translocation and assembly factor TamB